MFCATCLEMTFWRDKLHETFHSVALYPATVKIVGRQVARAAAEKSSTFRALVSQRFWLLQGIVHCKIVSCNLSRHNVAKTLRDNLYETFHSVTVPLASIVSYQGLGPIFSVQ